LYRDRTTAGKVLAEALKASGVPDPLVLAIPRGGVVVAREIALELDADLDIILTKKVGAPGRPEYAVAAVDAEGHVVMPRSEISREYILRQGALKQKEINATLESLRGVKPAKPLQGRHVVLVDDGLATGLTAIAAIRYLRRKGVATVTLAVPIAPQDTAQLLASLVDRLVCPLTPDAFSAVGQWYARFDQVDDGEVRDTLARFP
jgi:putative phosphoribosyl transferase